MDCRGHAPTQSHVLGRHRARWRHGHDVDGGRVIGFVRSEHVLLRDGRLPTDRLGNERSPEVEPRRPVPHRQRRHRDSCIRPERQHRRVLCGWRRHVDPGAGGSAGRERVAARGCKSLDGSDSQRRSADLQRAHDAGLAEWALRTVPGLLRPDLRTDVIRRWRVLGISYPAVTLGRFRRIHPVGRGCERLRRPCGVRSRNLRLVRRITERNDLVGSNERRIAAPVRSLPDGDGPWSRTHRNRWYGAVRDVICDVRRAPCAGCSRWELLVGRARSGLAAQHEDLGVRRVGSGSPHPPPPRRRDLLHGVGHGTLRGQLSVRHASLPAGRRRKREPAQAVARRQRPGGHVPHAVHDVRAALSPRSGLHASRRLASGGHVRRRHRHRRYQHRRRERRGGRSVRALVQQRSAARDAGVRFGKLVVHVLELEWHDRVRQRLPAADRDGRDPRRKRLEHLDARHRLHYPLPDDLRPESRPDAVRRRPGRRIGWRRGARARGAKHPPNAGFRSRAGAQRVPRDARRR